MYTNKFDLSPLNSFNRQKCVNSIKIALILVDDTQGVQRYPVNCELKNFSSTLKRPFALVRALRADER